MALAPAARQAVRAVDPDQPVTAVQTLRAHIEQSLGRAARHLAGR